MISLGTARLLKDAGLVWRPALHDFFAIPDRNLDQTVFVISDVQVTVEYLQGVQVVSFQGASEWALDSLVSSDAIWLPREDQLRQLLEEHLYLVGHSQLRLEAGIGGYRIQFQDQIGMLTFDSAEAGEAYAAALLYLLRRQDDPGSPRGDS